jgi:hypothetical protein
VTEPDELAGPLPAGGRAPAVLLKSGLGVVSGPARRAVSAAPGCPAAGRGVNSDAAELGGLASSGRTDPDALTPGGRIGRLDPDGLLATTVASSADGTDGREAPVGRTGSAGHTEPDAGQTDTDPDGLSDRPWPAGPAGPPSSAALAGSVVLADSRRLPGSTGLADSVARAGSAGPAGSVPLAGSGALVSAADSADPPVPSEGWPSCPGRLLCAPICTTSFFPASVSNPKRGRLADQMKKQAQNNGSGHETYTIWRIGLAGSRSGLNSREKPRRTGDVSPRLPTGITG